MSDKTYNGYTNEETWNVALWLDNDQGSYQDVIDMAERADDVRDLETALRDYVEEQNPLASDASLWSDLLSAALSEVNWRELAENYFQEYHKEEEQDDAEPQDVGADDDQAIHLVIETDGRMIWLRDSDVYDGDASDYPPFDTIVY